MTESPPMEKRATAQPVELRAGSGSRRIGGRAATFRSPSENLGGFIERVDPRFFSKSEGDGWPGVMARFQHSDAALLGTTAAGTLRLDVDHIGLNYLVDVPQSRDDVLELVARGDISASSIAFETWEDDWTTDNGTAVRTLLSGRLIDVAPVSQPAYRDTSVAMRSLADYVNADPADVFDLARQGELRKLLCRSDRPSERVSAYPGGGHRWRPDPATESRAGRDPVEALAQLTAKRKPDGSPRGGKDGRLAYLEALRLGWDMEPRPPLDGRVALARTLGLRWALWELEP